MLKNVQWKVISNALVKMSKWRLMLELLQILCQTVWLLGASFRTRMRVCPKHMDVRAPSASMRIPNTYMCASQCSVLCILACGWPSIF